MGLAMDKPIHDMRRDYVRHGLLEGDVAPDPIRQFDLWFDEVVKQGTLDANAMTLATVGSDRRPSARIVLLKGFDQRGFVFYSDYRSRKGLDLAGNPYAALCLYWPQFERQVRIEGGVTKTSEQESDDYFASRPRESQLAAAASEQSRVLGDRGALEQSLAQVREQHADQPVRRPIEWGGYRLLPNKLEFWQGRPYRLHDRLLYTRREDGSWMIERLSP